MPSLIELIHAAPETLDYPLKAATLPITGITADSRQVRAGNLFVALKGLHADGTAFIEQARQAGAAAILCDRQAEVALADIPLLRADNPSRALAFMAARFYKSQPEHMVAVTGTDGKTSVCDFFRQFWHGMGQPSASIGTLGILSGGGDLLFPSGYTTPTPVQLHKMLADLQGRGIGYAGLEASSQGLDQYRMDGVHLEAAAFTNIARDHMDYHHTDDAYFAAKARLFSEVLPTGKTAILNQDDAKFPELAAICERRKHAVLGFGRRGDHLRVAHIHPLPHGQQVDAELFGKPHRLDVPLVGAFQVMNILAALGLAMATGGDLDAALDVIPQLRGVPGRLEQVAQLPGGAAVFIDYAHTPMALANILNTLRPHTQGKLRVVFGCGGDRDAGKRPEMGRIAAMLADDVIVTDDNPRSEDPALIRAAIIVASRGAKEVADRRQAIYVALKRLEPGDVLVVAGKGHEKTQIIGSKTLPFDDGGVIRELTKELKLA
jgi:UDP-N-acetylmuramoyl-L-alanyl-D-glutamate--2,6-diaminopimelate ligase